MVRAGESAAVSRRVKRLAASLITGALIAGALLAFGSVPVGAAPRPAVVAAVVVAAPGVHPGEIAVGSVLDLTGPLAAEGIAIKNGLTLAFDDANAKGGVLGRRIRLLTRDSAYDPAKARAGAAALLGRGIFAMLCSNGTPPVSATQQMVLGRGVLHLFAVTPSHIGPPPLDRLQFGLELPVPAQIQAGLEGLLEQRGPLKTGVLYRDDTYGRAALKGATRALARHGQIPVAAVPFPPGTHDFSAQIQSLRAAGTELVVLGAVAQESFGALARAHARHWYPVFLCPSDCYVPEAATLGGRAVEGLYSVATTPIPYPGAGDRAVDAWVRRFESRFHTQASVQAFRAYLDGRLFVEALRRSGRQPTPLHFARVLEAMPPWTDPVYGGVAVDYSAHDHLGMQTGLLAQIAGGRWRILKAIAPPRF